MTAPDTQGDHITVGCAELPPGMTRAEYFRLLRFLEMRLPDRALTPPAIERLRDEAGGAQRLALVAPRSLCQVHRPGGPDADALEAGATDLARTAAQLGAAAVVFCTPPDLSPSTAHRDALRRFFADFATSERFARHDQTVRVWQPDGLWRPAVAAAFADELGIVAAVDPLAPDPLEEGVPDAPATVAYARVRGLGRPASRPLSADDLARLAVWAAPSQRAFIVFETPTRRRDAVALLRSLG